MSTNLTGIWQGLYSYPEAFDPVRFTATLIESGKWVSGSIHETAMDDDYIPVDVYATLMGSRDDRHVAFTKTYDGTSDWSHAVRYEGVLNDDFTEMEGRWSIPGVWSGKFLMIRPEGRRAGILREAFESV